MAEPGLVEPPHERLAPLAAVARPTGSIRTTIESPEIGMFSYEALTLALPDDSGHAIVVQVPGEPSEHKLRERLRDDSIGVVVE